MKKLGFCPDNAHIVKIASSAETNTATPASGFDLAKLLQILPKLNLNNLFGSPKNSAPRPTTPPPAHQFVSEFEQTQNLMSSHNATLAISTIETHKSMVQKLKSS